jgi:hypothetical protein
MKEGMNMRKVMLLAVLLVVLWCNSALAAYVMPIESGDKITIQNDIVAVMAKEYPNAVIVEQTQNLISFREFNQTFLLAGYRFFDFHIYPNINEQGGVGTKVTLHVRISAGTDLYEYDDEPAYDDILINVKALSDGTYLYGFNFEKNKITEVNTKSNSYVAGLRKGDRVISINGYKIMNNTVLGRVMACPIVTFEIEGGKIVTAEGYYVSKERYRQYYFQ